ncbi:hypothetical protein GCM10028816_30330 [Spirosoma lituiforme]
MAPLPFYLLAVIEQAGDKEYAKFTACPQYAPISNKCGVIWVIARKSNDTPKALQNRGFVKVFKNK